MGWSEFKESVAKSKAEVNTFAHQNRNNAAVRSLRLKGGYLNDDSFTKILAKDCTMELVNGSQRSRMTITRITLGTGVAGPLGGLVGALSTKDVSKAWIFVNTPKGEWKVKIPPKEADRAILFLRKFTAEHTAQLEGDVPQ